MSTEPSFERLAARFKADPAVSQGTGSGSSPGLRIRNKIFAMLIQRELVVKLPAPRVDELVASGVGARLDLGNGRLMKEWASVPAQHGGTWEELVAEALEFVGRTAQPRDDS